MGLFDRYGGKVLPKSTGFGSKSTARTSSRVPRRPRVPNAGSTRGQNFRRGGPTFRPLPPQSGGGYGGGTGGGGGGGGGGGFGGGTGGGTGGGNSEDALANNRGQRLKAALAAIKADFAAQRGGLEAQLGELKSLFERGMLANQRETRNTTEDVNEGAAERGLFRSGIRLKNLSRELAPLAEQRADLIADLNPDEDAEGSKVRDLMSLIKMLVPSEARAGAGAELESEREQLEFQKFLSLTGAGLSGVG